MIPDDWDLTPLNSLAAISHGYGFRSEYFTNAGKYRLTTPGHFHATGGFRDVGDKQKYYSGPLPTGYVLDCGDLIVVMTEQADGLLGSAAIVPIAGSYLHNQRLGKVTTRSPDVSIGFLFRIFNAPSFRAKVRATAAGTKVKHTSPARLLEIAVPIPTNKVEQEAIAEALSNADALVESQERVLGKKRQLKLAAMQELLTGRRRLPGFNGDWTTKRLGDVVAIRKGDLITERTAVPGAVPVIAGGKTPAYFNNHANRTGRTITISGSGASAGYVAFHNAPLFASDCSTIGEGTGYSVEFVYFALSLNQAAIYEAQTGGAQPHIHPSDLRPQLIAVPETQAEQTAIAAILSDIDAEVTALEARLTKARQIRDGMMQELLTGRIRLV